MLTLLLASLALSYPTETPPWVTPERVSKWPTDTEPWGAPPTEFPSDSDHFATSAIVGITIAAIAAASVIVLCIVILIRSRRPPALLRDYEHIRID